MPRHSKMKTSWHNRGEALPVCEQEGKFLLTLSYTMHNSNWVLPATLVLPATPFHSPLLLRGDKKSHVQRQTRIRI